MLAFNLYQIFLRLVLDLLKDQRSLTVLMTFIKTEMFTFVLYWSVMVERRMTGLGIKKLHGTPMFALVCMLYQMAFLFKDGSIVTQVL